MSAEETTPEQIEKVAGTEDENGVIQPSVEEILDPDPEDATAADASEMDGAAED